MSRLAVLTIMLLLGTTCVRAEDSDMERPTFSVSGFGTLGTVYHNKSGAQYRRDISQGDGVSAKKLSFNSDSMLGVQLDALLSPAWHATLQTVSRQNSEDSYTPEIMMAYLKFKPGDDLSIRAGRLLIETYLQGDSAEVGYANLQIRQPIIFFPRGFDGLDAETSRPLADGILRLKGAAGWTYGKLSINSGNGSLDTHGSQLLEATVEYMRQHWTWHGFAGRLKLHNEIDALENDAPFPTALLAAAPNGASILNKLRQKNRELFYWSLASAYDNGPAQASASYTVVSSADWPTRHLFYVNGGYRIAAITPYISFAAQHSSRDTTPTGIPSGIGLDALNQQATLAQANFMVNQTDFTLGGRYDFTRNMALKLQADRIRYRDAESIIDTAQNSTLPESRRYKTLNLLSLALDFVF